MSNVPNILPFPVEADSPQGQYIDSHGVLLEQFGLPAATGRIFAYLLLRDEPATLDTIAHDLEISKSSASVGARHLLDAGVARRLTQRGSRVVLYESVDSFESLVEADIVRRAMLVEKWRQGVVLAPSERARQRIEQLVELFDFTMAETRATLERWRSRPRR
jgi:DNA-binding transcriptional regulator GbsR (MarR family)